MKDIRMYRLLPLLVVTLAGCATTAPSVPPGYAGPVVSVADTGLQEDASKGRFFALLELDGRRIANALHDSRIASYGKGFALTSRYTRRDIPVRAVKVRLIGTHQTAAPIHEMASRMAGTFFSVEGVVDFSPVEGRTYEVTGALAKKQSCAWIAEVVSQQPVTEKICAP